jgi:electron transfer flavoprotein alpha/beta subunit
LNIIVCVKQTPDIQQVRIRKETREPVLENVPLTLSNLDKNALEEAVRKRWRKPSRKPWRWARMKPSW